MPDATNHDERDNLEIGDDLAITKTMRRAVWVEVTGEADDLLAELVLDERTNAGRP